MTRYTSPKLQWTYKTSTLDNLRLSKTVRENLVADVSAQFEANIPIITKSVQARACGQGLQMGYDAAVLALSELLPCVGELGVAQFLDVMRDNMIKMAEAIEAEYDEQLELQRETQNPDISLDPTYTKDTIDSVLAPLYGERFLPWNERYSTAGSAMQEEMNVL